MKTFRTASIEAAELARQCLTIEPRGLDDNCAVAKRGGYVIGPSAVRGRLVGISAAGIVHVHWLESGPGGSFYAKCEGFDKLAAAHCARLAAVAEGKRTATVYRSRVVADRDAEWEDRYVWRELAFVISGDAPAPTDFLDHALRVENDIETRLLDSDKSPALLAYDPTAGILTLTLTMGAEPIVLWSRA